MKVIYFIRNALQLYPPCINQICYLDDLGVDVTVYFGECTENVKLIFDERKIRYIDFNIKRNFKGVIGKLESIIKYKNCVKKILNSKIDRDSILWFGTADSAFMVSNLIKNKNYVLSILELYDDNNFYRRNIEKIIKMH